ncbi:OmpA domain protein [Ichthyobacterium seriolicida]|uniref:OmpA domain protein n=1 Tax=Ichthyobacterium seriolicida TaxID=242600 RepID=A0A1J1DY93_9FLAO|nr:OmpA domain protein [Ichthyobacterium seriolicida]
MSSFKSKNDKAAIYYVTKVIKADKNDRGAYILRGDIFRGVKQSQKAIEDYQDALKIKDSHDVYYKLALAFFDSSQYIQAKDTFEKYLSVAPNNVKIRNKVDNYLKSCDFAIEEKNNQKDFKLRNLEDINTQHSEYHPVISIDNKQLIYTIAKKKNGIFQEDFYMSKKIDDKWQVGVPLSKNLNTLNNEGAHCISADGKYLFFTGCNKIDGYGSCDLYLSVKTKGGWSKPSNLGMVINTKYWEGHPSISSDGKTLYFSSSRPGGQGQRDIWSSVFDGNSWAEPKNIKELNSSGDETAPFIHIDDQTLYFSSDGWVGMGRSDFFMSKKDDDNVFKTPKNLGFSINSPYDEYSLVIGNDGVTGYLSSDFLSNNKGEMDIYEFTLPQEYTAKKMGYLKGTISSENMHTLEDVQISISNLDDNNPVNNISFAEDDGNYLAILPSDKRYGLQVMAKDHLIHSETFDFMLDTIVEVEKNIELKLLEKGNSILLNNIYFDTNKWDLKESSITELNKATHFLNINPEIKVEIIGHTDSVGNDRDNLLLSERRAESVYLELIKKGIDKVRLTHKGFGAQKPISDNQTERGRKQNRRIELKIR